MTTLAPIHTAKLTAEQYFQLGEDPPGMHLELIEGEIIVSPSPSRTHAEVVFAIAYLMETHIRKHRLGKFYLDTDVVFAAATVRRPDIAYFNAIKLNQMSGEKLILPPDLCVEVLSPSNEDDDRINKFHLYESHGVPYYWIIDPVGRTAECFGLKDGKYSLLASGRDFGEVRFPPFTDFMIPLRELWTSGKP